MKHHFATWSKRLDPNLRARFEARLLHFERVVAKASDATPQALRKSGLSYVSDPAAKRETALAALECASVCRASHPDDARALCAVMKVALKCQVPFEPGEIQRLLEFLAAAEQPDPKTMPVDELVRQIERRVTGQPAPAEWQPLLETIGHSVAASVEKKPKSVETLLRRIAALCDDAVSTRLKPDQGWADLLGADLAALSPADRRRWEGLLGHASSVTPQPPAKDWDVAPGSIKVSVLDTDAWNREHDRLFFARKAASAWKRQMHEHVTAVGPEPFERMRIKWLQAVPDSKPGTLSQFSVNRELLRGLLWTCEGSDDAQLCRAIRIAGEYLYRKNSPLGRAAVRILAHLPAANVLEELTYLAQQAKKPSRVRLVQAARAIVAERCGVPPADLADLPLPTSGFTEFGRRVESLAGFTAELAVTGSESAAIRWFKPDGQPQKSIPAKVKRDHAAELRDLKAAVKELTSTLATARQRLDAGPLEQRSWSVRGWRERYVDHPVAGTIGRRVIWQFEHDGAASIGAFHEGTLVDAEGHPLQPAEGARVSVLHPLGLPAEEVLRWRERLAAWGVTQPFKQAYREIYVLTDAERATETYSNRFAAHVLKQSQFRVLAKTRGWQTSYLGPWDGGHDGGAGRELPAWDLRAELRVFPTAGEEFAQAGGFFYVSTDQLRFYRTDPHDPLPLADVPPLAFSEVMRDVDLFVAVASVGNDPTWQDGGPDGWYADYWRSYSFGELSESAVARRSALERIVPQLNIADRCRLEDRFLVVRGDLRTYRIHLGSGNILMEPNNEYLCIVPARGRLDDGVFLPFEGDSRLSTILSKALLLAAGASITDPTITSQIERR